MQPITTPQGNAQLVDRNAYDFTMPMVVEHPDFREGERRAAAWIALGDCFSDQKHFIETAEMMADDLMRQYTTLSPMMRGWYMELDSWLFCIRNGRKYYPAK